MAAAQAKRKSFANDGFFDVRDGTNGYPALTDYGNAVRLQEKHKGTVYFVPSVGWLQWCDGWRFVDDAVIRKHAYRLKSLILDEARQRRLPKGEMDYYREWARRAENGRNAEAAIRMWADEEQLPVNVLDARDSYVGFNDAKSILDLDTGRTRPARCKDYVTKSLGVSSIGDEKQAVQWTAFLNEVFSGDAELIDWIRRFFGYCLFGSAVEDVFVFGYGGGGNGKTAICNVMQHVFGEYYQVASIDSFTERKRKGSAASSDLYALAGARLVVSGEAEKGQAINEAVIKLLNGRDRVSVRELFRKQTTFQPQFKMFLHGNHLPPVTDDSHGFWRRIRVVPMNAVFEGEDRISRFEETLYPEAPHIAAWLVRGARDWKRRGLNDLPRAIEAANAAYRAGKGRASADEDVERWLKQHCEFAAGVEAPFPALRESYKQWAILNRTWNAANRMLRTENEVLTIDPRRFGKSISEKFPEKRESNGNTIYIDVRLKCPGQGGAT